MGRIPPARGNRRHLVPALIIVLKLGLGTRADFEKWPFTYALDRMRAGADVVQ